MGKPHNYNKQIPPDSSPVETDITRILEGVEEVRRALRGDEFSGSKGLIGRMDEVEDGIVQIHNRVEFQENRYQQDKIYKKGIAIGLGLVTISSVGSAGIGIKVLQTLLGGP